MNTMKHIRYWSAVFFIAAAMLFFAPAVRTQAAAADCGPVNAKWVKSGNYSYQLKKNGTLVFKTGKGKEQTIAKKVRSARYHGSRVVYTLGVKDEDGWCKTPCRIYDCYKKKTVRKAILKDRDLPFENKLLGFYNDNVVTTCSSGAALSFTNMKNGRTKIMQDGKYWKPCYPVGYQEGRYLVYLASNALEVMDLYTGKASVISKKGYSVFVHNGMLYYAEAQFKFNTDNKAQTVKICSCTVSGKNKKLLGSFKTTGKNYIDSEGADLSIIPVKSGAYIRQTVRKNDRSSYEYKALNYKTKKLQKSSKKEFNKKAKTVGLAAYGVTYFKDDSLDLE